MTVPEENPRTRYVGDGSTTRFAVPWELIDVNTFGTDGVANLSVWLEEPQSEAHPVFGTVDGAVQQFMDKDWLWDRATREIVFNTAPGAGDVVVILRDTYDTQEVDYQQLVPFLMDGAPEYGLDKLTHLTQEKLESLRRAVKARVSDLVGGGDGYPASFRRLIRMIPAKITANGGSGEYTIYEQIFDANLQAFRNKVTTDPGGTVVEVSAHDINLCAEIDLGTFVNAYLFEAADTTQHWRFNVTGCARMVYEYLACDGSGDKIYFDGELSSLGEVILYPA